jgi:hypothetical protein
MMVDFLVGSALLVAAIYVWGVLGRSRLGRCIQAVCASICYLAWLSIVPAGAYFAGRSIIHSATHNGVGTTVFLILASLALIPIIILPLITWNPYCQFLWRKVGLRLPQSRRFPMHRKYYKWDRQV